MLAKHKNTQLKFDFANSGLQNSPEYKEIMQSIKECNRITDAIISQFAAVDYSTRQFQRDIYAISEGFSSASDKLMNAAQYTGDANTATLIGLSSLALDITGSVVKIIGSNKAKKKRKKKQMKKGYVNLNLL